MRTKLYTIICTAIVSIVLFATCKKTDPPVYSTDLQLFVVDLDSADVSSGKAYLFASNEDYLNAVTNGDFGKALDSLSFNDGKATFSNLNETTSYYVLVTTVKNGVEMNNYFSNYHIKNELTKDAITKVLVKLTPYNVANMFFWADAGNAENLDILFEFDDQEARTITTIRTTAPSSTDSVGSVGILFQKSGTYKWKASGSNGCYWEGEVTFDALKSKNDVVVKLEDCKNGRVLFWSKMNNNPVTITIEGDNGSAKSLSTSRTTAPTTCTDINAISYSLPLGNYVYKATDKNNACFWEGKFSINTSGCSSPVVIEIVDCL